jgi:3D-(3,5/4)-trihydroxycyclohexane-1,2-dione acylhydrolase (decyclizing)
MPERWALQAAVAAIRSAKSPFVVAGGGVLYSDAEKSLQAFVEQTGIPVGTTQAGGGVLDWDNPQNLGGVGATGTAAANRIAGEADLVIGIGTRYSDFTTGSRTVFKNAGVTFVNINVAPFDAYKHGTQLPLIADARETIDALHAALASFRVADEYAARIAREKADWDAVVDAALQPTGAALPGQPEIIGAVHQASAPRDVLVQAAGSLPGDLHKLWRVRDPLGYHVEYAFSTMGYEIAGGLGVKRGLEAFNDDRDVIVMVGDGSYLMLHIKIIVVLIQNQGYASIGHLSETVGSQRYGTRYRYRDARKLNFEDGDVLPVDLAANARSYGIEVIEIAPGNDAMSRLSAAVTAAKASRTSTLIHIESDPQTYAPDGGGWWDVPVAQVSELDSTRRARSEYESKRSEQRPLLGRADR